MGQVCCSKEELHVDPRFQLSQSVGQYRSVLLSGSMTLHAKQQCDRSEEIFRIMRVGNYFPCHRNKRSESIWTQVISNAEEGYSKISTYQDENELFLQFRKDKMSHLSSHRHHEESSWIFSQSDKIINRVFTMKGEKSFKDLVMIGPPQNYRWSCWKQILLMNYSSLVKPGQYERMLEKPSKDIEEIAKDMDRTLSTHPYFEQAMVDQNFGQNQLARVLNAISNTLPGLGYCQGMNLLSGLMLIVSSCDESMCYASFLSLLLSPKHLLYFLYCPDMPFHNFMAYMITKQVKSYFPQVYKTVKSENIPEFFWISKMIISLFLYIIDLNNCVRAWDYIIARGSIQALPELMLGVIDKIEDKLTGVKIEEFASVFQGFVISSEKDQDTFDKNFKIGAVIHDAQQQFPLSRHQVAKYAKKYLTKLKKSKNDLNLKHLKFYELFTHFDQSSYEDMVKNYMKCIQH